MCRGLLSSRDVDPERQTSWHSKAGASFPSVQWAALAEASHTHHRPRCWTGPREWVCEGREPPWGSQAQERDHPELGVTLELWLLERPRPGVSMPKTGYQVPQELASTSLDSTCELRPVNYTLCRLPETCTKSVDPSQIFPPPPPARQPGGLGRPDLWSRSRTGPRALRVARTF